MTPCFICGQPDEELEACDCCDLLVCSACSRRDRDVFQCAYCCRKAAGIEWWVPNVWGPDGKPMSHVCYLCGGGFAWNERRKRFRLGLVQHDWGHCAPTAPESRGVVMITHQEHERRLAALRKAEVQP
jgi:hypothetical protein